jgi:DNA-directed RNA polymerase beta' subunit
MPRKRIAGIQFHMVPNDLRDTTVMELTTHECLDRSQPKLGGPSDRQLGTTTRDGRCETCGFAMEACPGHSARLILSRPMLDPVYVDYTLNVCRATCRECQHLCLEMTDAFRNRLLKMTPQQREKAIATICKKQKKRTCSHCGTPKDQVILSDGHIVCLEAEPEDRKVVEIEEVLRWLQAIPDDVATLLGFDGHFSRPESLVRTSLIPGRPTHSHHRRRLPGRRRPHQAHR